MKRRIGIDFRLANNSYRGMARYCREIAANLIKLDTENYYYLIIDNDPKFDLSAANFEYIKIPKSNYIFEEQFHIPILLYKLKLDIFWSPYNTFPIIFPTKTKLIVTIHDLIFFDKLKKPYTFRQLVGKIYRKKIIQIFKYRIKEIFTVSEYSKDKIRENVSSKIPINITYNCINNFTNKLRNINLNNCDNKNFFFTVSGDSPNKNLKNLIEVFSENFKTEKLIIAGVSNNSKLRKYNYPNITILNEKISDNELIKLYLDCKCFLFFSKSEGFGIPLIEAAVCKKPILASDTTCIPEILGKYGVTTGISKEDISTIIENFICGNLSDMNLDNSVILSKFSNWSIPSKIVLDSFNKIKL